MHAEASVSGSRRSSERGPAEVGRASGEPGYPTLAGDFNSAEEMSAPSLLADPQESALTAPALNSFSRAVADLSGATQAAASRGTPSCSRRSLSGRLLP